MTPEEKRAYHLAYYHRNKEKNRAKLQVYWARQRVKYRDKRNAYMRQWHSKNKEHDRRPKACQKCRRMGKVEAHHPDYRKPLQVQWLCSPCHKKADKCK